jgi:hypothetical protein
MAEIYGERLTPQPAYEPSLVGRPSGFEQVVPVQEPAYGALDVGHGIERAAPWLAGTWTAGLLALGWMAVPIAIGLVSRLAVIGVGLLAMYLIPDNRPGVREVLSGLSFLDPWFKWDGSWYATIALNGYQTSGQSGQTLAFWPLLPTLEWVFSRPLVALGVAPAQAVFWAGFVVVNLTFVAACVMLYGLIKDHFGADTARRVVAVLAFSPGAIFYTAVYPEALLLLGVAACLWALTRRQWALAGVAGMWAALAHVPGCLLVLPFAWEYLRNRGWQIRPGWRVQWTWRIGWGWLWAGLMGLGPAIWLAYLWTVTGDPLAPVSAAYKHWPHRSAFPVDTLIVGIGWLLREPDKQVMGFLDLGVTLAAIAASVWALRAGKTSWGIWGLAVLVLYLSVPSGRPFEGMVRYVLPILPMWVLLARAGARPLAESAVIGSLAVFQGLLVALYVNQFWIG